MKQSSFRFHPYLESWIKVNPINVVGLGPSDLDELTLKVYKTIKKFPKVYVRTKDHPSVRDLENEGIEMESFDFVYDHHDENFDLVYPDIVERLIEKSKEEEILYAVPGHPNVAEKTVKLLQESDAEVNIIGGKSFIDNLFQAVKVDPVDGFQLLDSFDVNPDTLQTSQHLIIMQVFHSLIASDVKLKLMEKYPDDFNVYLVDEAGGKNESVQKVKLFELDHFDEVYNLRSVYIPPLEKDKRTRSFDLLQTYIDEIISDEGDIWITSQTNQSLIKYLREEVDEYIEALEQEDIDGMVEELGDVLMQVLYQAKLAEENYYFSVEDVMESLNKKLRRRHPHVFDGVKAETPEEVDALWQSIKEREKRGEFE